LEHDLVGKPASTFPDHALGARGGAEALLRAFLAERDRDRRGARFWIDVYELILKEER